jgi:threonyl-tRNA synthetase
MVIVPVAEVFNDYGREVLTILRKAGFRVELDATNDSLGKKVRNAEQDKLNYALVIGEAEMQSRSVAVRNIRSKEQVVMSLDEFVKLASEELSGRKL